MEVLAALVVASWAAGLRCLHLRDPQPPASLAPEGPLTHADPRHPAQPIAKGFSFAPSVELLLFKGRRTPFRALLKPQQVTADFF